MSRSQRRAMIDREEPKLSLVRQCALLGISRSSLYYLPTEAGAEDLELMALIDQQYLKTPFYGSRRMTAWLSNHGRTPGQPQAGPPADAADLMAIMDWHSRYVLAWRLSNILEVDFCVAALEAWRPSTGVPTPASQTQGIRSIRTCSGGWRSTGSTRCGPPTSPTYPWLGVSST